MGAIAKATNNMNSNKLREQIGFHTDLQGKLAGINQATRMPGVSEGQYEQITDKTTHATQWTKHDTHGRQLSVRWWKKSRLASPLSDNDP